MLLFLALVLACGPSSRPSTMGETCSRTADCAPPLRCVDARCVSEADATRVLAARAALPPTPPSLEGVYVVDVAESGREGDHSLLRSVEVTPTQTLVRFSMTRLPDKASRVRFYPPTHTQALRLVDARTGRVVPLMDLQNVQIAPDWTSLPSTGALEAVALFARIPDDMTLFHLVEGTMETVNEEPWTWLNIPLDPSKRTSPAKEN